MADVDDMIRRYEERNKDKIDAEKEQERNARVFLFNQEELLFRAIAGAAFNACRRLDIDPGKARGELTPNHETKRWEVVLTLEGDASSEGDVQAVMQEEFQKASAALEPERKRMAAVDDAFKAVDEIPDDYFARFVA